MYSEIIARSSSLSAGKVSSSSRAFHCAFFTATSIPTDTSERISSMTFCRGFSSAGNSPKGGLRSSPSCYIQNAACRQHMRTPRSVFRFEHSENRRKRPRFLHLQFDSWKQSPWRSGWRKYGCDELSMLWSYGLSLSMAVPKSENVHL